MNPKKMQYQSKKYRKKKNSKTKIYVVTTIAIIIVLSMAIYRFMMNNYNYLKQNINEHIIYTQIEQKYTKYTKEIPYVNMKSTNIIPVNKEIQQFGNKYINIEKSIVSYEYSINGEILSVILKASSYENKYPEIEFVSYNINLKEENIVDDQTLLSYYGIDENYVSHAIENKLKKYYNDLVKNKYFEAKACNFTCFLGNRGISSYTEDIEYYIKDSKLYAYKPFYTVSVYAEQNYFKEEHFLFELAQLS